MESSIDQVYGSYPPKKTGKGERDPEGGIGGGERPPGVAVWVAEGIIRVVLGVAASPCGCGV